MDVRDPKDCPYFLLSRATLEVTASLKKNFAAAGVDRVKPAYLGVLMCLWREEGLKVVELGRRAGLEPSTMTGLIDRMVADGLVEGSADPEDRRVQRIHLTSEGRKIRAKVLAVVDETLDAVLRGIDGREIERTKQTLRRVLANVQEGVSP
ncbi:MAG: MarR family transcriptional regulator [Nitrospirae bacterium]|nr:MarR family transcriptional regulator [Nitrospirota bacterium]